jgi:hypothetical protein
MRQMNLPWTAGHKDVVRDFLNQLKKFGDRPSQSPKEGETSEESAEARQ